MSMRTELHRCDRNDVKAELCPCYNIECFLLNLLSTLFRFFNTVLLHLHFCGSYAYPHIDGFEKLNRSIQPSVTVLECPLNS